MSAPVAYKDLGKAASDVLNKDFVSGLGITAETKASDGTEIKVALKNLGDKPSASFKPKFRLKAIDGAEVSVDVGSSGSIDLEGSKKDFLLDGLKVTVKASSKDLALSTPKGKTEFDFKHQRVAIAAAFDLLGAKTPSLAASVVVPMDNLQFGVNTKTDVGNNPALSAFDLRLAYSTGDFKALLYRNAGSSVTYGASYHQLVSRDIKIAAEIKSVDAAAPSLVFGGQFALDNGATFKAKASTDARLGFSYGADLNRNVKVTLGLDVDSKNTQDHKVGVALKLSQ